MKSQSLIILKGNGRLPESPTRPLTHHLKENAHNLAGEEIDDPISGDEDQSTDPVSHLSYNLKPLTLLPPFPTSHKQGHKGKAAKPTARFQYHEGEGDQSKRPVLFDKSTNYPILTQPTTATGAAYDSVAATTFPQLLTRDLHPSPKLHLKKLGLSPQNTPQLITEVELPMRPSKLRQAGLSLVDQDFPIVFSPSKACKPKYRSDFWGYSKISSGSPFCEPILPGVNDPGMDDSIGTISRTWAHERAKTIFSGKNQAAERILGVTPSSAGPKQQQQKNITPKLKDRVHLVIQKCREAQKGRTKRFLVPSPSGIESSPTNVVGLRDFPEDPFSPQESHELYQNINGKVSKRSSAEPRRAVNTNRESRPESIPNLVPGSTRIESEQVAIRKRSNAKSKIEEGGGLISSFPAIAGPGLGAAYGFNHSESDNEMLSSSPIAKSTPKKDWYRYEYPDTVNTLRRETNRQTLRTKQIPVKATILAIGSSDTDCLEGMAMGEHTNEDVKNRGDESSWDRSKIGGGRKGPQEVVPRLGGMKYRVTAPGGEHRKSPYKIEIPEGGTGGKGRSYCRPEMIINGFSNSEEGITTARAKIIDLKERKVNPRKRSKYLIRMDGSRTGKPLSRDKKLKLTEGVAFNFSDSKSKSKRPIVPRVGGVVGKKGIEIRKSSLGYDRMEMDDDVDELQMDLPGMRI